MRKLTYAQAISEATVQKMAADPAVFVAGIGVDDHIGIFGTTREAFERFGRARVIDIPNMENAFSGIAIGAAAMGMRPLVVHPRIDFTFLATDMLINLAAKWAYMYQNETRVPVVVRAIVGRGWGQGATHSQSLHATYGHFPGLNVVAPCFPADAKGLLVAALESSSPTIIVEHRACYGLEGDVSPAATSTKIGSASVQRVGQDITIVGASLMAYEAARAADILARDYGISAEVIDARSIRPLDEQTILESVERTGRLVVADTSWATYGFASEVAALVAEQGYGYLKAPVKRVALPDCPAPVSKSLEDAYHPGPETIVRSCLEVLGVVPSTYGAREATSGVQEAFQGPY